MHDNPKRRYHCIFIDLGKIEDSTNSKAVVTLSFACRIQIFNLWHCISVWNSFYEGQLLVMLCG